MSPYCQQEGAGGLGVGEGLLQLAGGVNNLWGEVLVPGIFDRVRVQYKEGKLGEGQCCIASLDVCAPPWGILHSGTQQTGPLVHCG